MNALDQWMTQLGSGPGTVLLVAIMLGLRHATDPDHVAAVSTLVLGDLTQGVRRARVLGTMWGLGHGATLFLFGLPDVLFRKFLSESVRLAAEVAVAGVIVALAVRLLLRWRRGYYHAHPHDHDGKLHVHPHMHEHPKGARHPEKHGHRHAEVIGRSPLAAFGIGMIHGVGGSAGAGILLVGAAANPFAGVLALLLFALATVVSMTLITSVLGAILSRSRALRQLQLVIPSLGLASLCFGIWYGLDALS